MAAMLRRVGAETSKTRDALLDSVERLMSEEGYASVTYRAVAAKAGVTPVSSSTIFRPSMTSSSPQFAVTLIEMSLG
jgi:DNA-binding transcriptional regulator YbjK